MKVLLFSILLISEGLYAAVIENLSIDVPVIEWAAEEGVDDDDIAERSAQWIEKQAERAAQTRQSRDKKRRRSALIYHWPVQFQL